MTNLFEAYVDIQIRINAYLNRRKAHFINQNVQANLVKALSTCVHFEPREMSKGQNITHDFSCILKLNFAPANHFSLFSLLGKKEKKMK